MAPTVEQRPDLSTAVVERAVRDLYGLDGLLTPLPGEWDQNFRLDAAEAGEFVVKLANAGIPAADLDFQNAALAWLEERWAAAAAPRLVASHRGEKISRVAVGAAEPWRLRVVTWLPGEPLSSVAPAAGETLESLGRLLGDLDGCLAGFEHPAMARELRWDLRQWRWIGSRTGQLRDVRRRGIVERFLLQFRARAEPLLDELPVSVIHNDANDENVLVWADGAGAPTATGLLDYGDMVRTSTVCEPAIAAAYACFGSGDPLAALASVAAGYHRARPLAAAEIEALFPLMVLRLCVSVVTSALAAAQDGDNAHRQISDAQAWAALERLERIDWRDAERAVSAACGLEPPPARRSAEVRAGQHAELIEERRRRLGPSLSLDYDDPLEIVRGRGQYLFDADGRAYLDCVNNVCHVGHCHPRVVAALARQGALLNTNTRYLHRLVLDYARRLIDTLPAPLEVCYFVNSGTEANELALRIARALSGRQDVIVLEGAYHGHSQTLIELSPYKCEGPGGQGLAEWAHKAASPDPYRGAHRGRDEEAGRAYAEKVRELCERLTAEGRPPGVFICEPIIGCGGQIVPPEGYLRLAFEHVRAAGGVCIADEVQVGMGRVGSHFWGCLAQGAVPDIVTVGKPIGNGHPLAAVITTREAAQAFDNGMEFFATFGGNPVSVAVGEAVLDVVEEEGLQEQAARVGGYLRDGFQRLGERCPEVGDVRGLGLFIGVELVEDRHSLAPASELTARVLERVKADGIVLTAEGPGHNVLKIKPPMVFDETDADLLLGAVERALIDVRGTVAPRPVPGATSPDSRAHGTRSPGRRAPGRSGG